MEGLGRHPLGPPCQPRTAASNRHFLAMPGDTIEKIDTIFSSDPISAAVKAIGVSQSMPIGR
ncbi:hypothetical protein NITHO_2960004 [Nitrolancea hollandica Lb]|uniref:Uncharacterized protein n=1 Tax=Nitrolancea hollandica Lb TaxID=1129897 RepID=I4EH20_9BACT|nr:hypothetical protein NITHO_2960004 [Nitrolancea hollandica Lb]